MKKNIITFWLLVLVAYATATVWHVNNVNIPTGAPSILRDFTDLQSANDSSVVVNGDTLYIYAGNYGGVTLTKQLTIIGTGYFLNENPETQFNTQASYVEGISFNTGSENSVLTGVSASWIHVNETNDVTIKRNYVSRNADWTVLVTNSYNTILLQNYINTQWGNCIRIQGAYSNPITGIQVKNNIMFHQYTEWGSPLSPCIYSSAALLLDNNFFRGGIDVIGANVNNNILWGGSYNGHETSIFMNNMCDGTQFAPDEINGNQCNKDIPGLVILWSGTTDGRFQLRTGSPAIGAGVGGVDCGAFGGGTPYVLSGMPSEIPSVWFFESNYVGYTYPFHIKAKAHR